MSRSKPKGSPLQRVLFGLAVGGFAVLQLLYVANLIGWRSVPDRGWQMYSDTGLHVVAIVRPVGEEAGLRQNDRIVTINGKPYSSYAELLSVLNYEIGGGNVYVVERGSETFTVEIPTRPLALATLLRHSGLRFALGLVFVSIGVLVFLMKPYTGASWAFLLMTCLLGTYVPFAGASHLYEPRALEHVFPTATSFLAASMFHLTAFFPRRRSFFAQHPQWVALPYALSFLLAVYMISLGNPQDIPAGVERTVYLYGLASLVAFLGSTLQIFLGARSQAERLQSLVIFTGSLIALFVPLTEQIYGQFAGVRFFPDLVLFTVIFLALFPISIGYAIVQHDLFEIDTIIRRTYGYLLNTAVVVALYGGVVSGLNVAVGPTDVMNSPFFSVAFILGIVFLMQPLQGRIQGMVDRAFYRLQYDYHATITQVSESMTSLLDPLTVQRTLVDSVVEEMFLENGILLTADGDEFEVGVVAGIEWPAERPRRVRLAPALQRALVDHREGVFQHEIELAPEYEADRESMAASFDSLGAELMLPMVLKDEVRSVLSLGGKKSGKLFTREDIALLRTLINEGAVALENARLFDEVAANLKRIQMLETVKGNLAKFVPQTVQALLEESPDASGLFEKREADLSVMFADMTGYTRISAKLSMVEVNSIIEEYFSAFLEEILSAGGDVTETGGDGLMVLFRDEDPNRHARAAVSVAVAIQRLTREINAQRLAERPTAEPIGMHIGVNTGIASVGATKISAGAGALWTYTASGTVTNVASRVGALGEEIAITDATRDRLGDGFVIEEMGPQALKNVPEPVMVYRVLAAPEVAESTADERPPALAQTDTAPAAEAEERAGRFVIHGTLFEAESKRPLEHLVVRAFDKDLLFDDYLGEARSDAAGRFEVRFTDEFFGDLMEKKPDIYLEIYDRSGDRQLLSTERAVRWNAGAVEHFEIEIPGELLAEGDTPGR